MSSVRHLLIGAALAIAAAPTAAFAQAAPSEAVRWAPWIGCWQVAEESVQDGAQLLDDASDAEGRHVKGALVCVAPADGGVTVTTLINDKPVVTDTIVADGSQRPLSDPACRGWQRTEWSQHGARLYARAEMTCGDQPGKTVSGFAAMMAGPVWLDIQMIESQGAKSVRVRRYHRASDQRHAVALPAALRQAAAGPLRAKLTLAEIEEASSKVPVETVQAAVLELSRGGYDLNARRLMQLDAAGVDDRVIDLLVAMSFPKQFVVERGGGGGGYGGGFWGDPMTRGIGGMWPYNGLVPYVGMWPFDDDMYYSSYYSPFGYSNWGYFDPRYYRYGYSPFTVILPDGGTNVAPSGEGRVVDGRGYTRIRRVEPEPAQRAGGNGGWSTAGAGAAGNGPSSGTSGVSSGGYSSGGSGGSGRTAVPRPPGGGQ